MDVHMAADGANMTCVDCHKGSNHTIPGKALSVSISSGGTTLGCDTCHAGTPHKNGILNPYASLVIGWFLPAVDQSHHTFVGSVRAKVGMWQVWQATFAAWVLRIPFL